MSWAPSHIPTVLSISRRAYGRLGSRPSQLGAFALSGAFYRLRAAHTTNLVHIIYVAKDAANFTCRDGILADVAPTLLFLLGLPQPKEMTGRNLLASKSKE